MAKSKQSAAKVPTVLTRFLAFVQGRGRPLVAGLIVAGVFLGTWYYVWREVRAHVFASSDYVFTVESLEISPPPPWIHTDIRAEVFGAASFSRPLSILDDDLTQRLGAAFALHPWVSKVRQVTKHHPARVKVDLEYRQPVLMVDTSSGLLPVEAQGMLLPAGDFSPVEQARYPRLIGVETQPMGTLGERWGDPRVFGAAQIAAAIGPQWLEWRLDRIMPSLKPASNASEDYLYILLTRSGTQVFWGRSPHSNVSGELPTSEKLARLSHYFATHGTLDGRDGSQQLDIRNMRRS
jgi:hypothetical protein